MKISQFNSRSERERESSLRTSLSLKKSFTLIELSIVLLILSLLVGSLLVGRQIVDRAKIHKVITELNFYDNILHQFYDTYREVPGSMSYKNCMKYSEFQGITCLTDTCTGATTDPTVVKDHQAWCSAFGINASTNAKIIDQYDKTDEQIPAVLQASKLVDFKIPPYSNKKLDGVNRQIFSLHINGGFSVNAFYASYKPTVRVILRGWSAKWLPNFLSGDRTADSTTLYNLVLNKNTISFYDDTTSTARRTKYGAALSSKMMSELDAKIDDGRPMSGRLIGLRNKKTYTMTDAEQLSQYCYDKTGENVERAIYNSDTNEEYGCNITYIMSDVK